MILPVLSKRYSVLITPSCMPLPIAHTHTHTPLVYYAAQEGHLDCVHCLVDQFKAEPLLASTDGMTPLHAAAQTGRLNITHWLVRSAGCPITSRTVDGATPIHFAAAKGELWERLT